MVGRNSADNKFGFTPYIVGKTLGDGCNYSTIQSAIDDAFAAGGGVVTIRPDNTPYVENLTFRAGVDVIGWSVDGRVQAPAGKVSIIGNHTYAGAAGFQFVLLRDLSLSDLGAGTDILTISPIAGQAAVLAMKECNISSGGPGGRCVVLNAAVGAQINFVAEELQMNSDSHLIDFIGGGAAGCQMAGTTAQSNNGNILNFSAGSCSATIYKNCRLSAVSIVVHSSAVGGGVNCSFSDFTSQDEAFLNTAGVCSFNLNENLVNSSAASGFWIAGAGANISYADVVLGSTAVAIDPAVSVSVKDWQPFAQTAAGPGTGFAGTSYYDSTDFTVTSGFVEISGSTSGAVTQLGGDTGSATPVAGVINIFGGPGVTTNGAGQDITVSSVLWTDVALPGVLPVDSGYFDVGPNTYTLPAAPTQGEQFRMFSINSPTVLQANVGQTIQIGNATSSLAGTATGTDTGDCLVLIFYAAGSRWCAESVVGNWILA